MASKKEAKPKDTTTIKGVVKWYSPFKGYGFIAGEDGNDYFVHQTNIVMDGFRKLRDGQTVSFAAKKQEDGRLIAESVAV